jgi:hypothetical protein
MLARAWATRADAIAAAAAAGHGCRAQALADSLRDHVVNADTRVPAAFRTTLLKSVNALADRITCTPPATTVTTPPTTASQPPQNHDHPTHPKHGHPGPDNQGNGNQGNDN